MTHASSFGFQTSFPGAPESSATRVERKAEALLLDATSLLVYGGASGVLSSEAAKAFCATLSAVKRADGPASLTAFASFFAALHASTPPRIWSELLVDGVLASENAFARAAARHCGGSTPDALLAAARHDLCVLQRLSLEPHELASWVASTSALREQERTSWLRAADLLQAAPFSGAGAHDGDAGGGASVGPPAPRARRAALRAAVLSSPSWADAAPQLAAYHAQFGVGAPSSHAQLMWSDGSLRPLPRPLPPPSAPDNFFAAPAAELLGRISPPTEDEPSAAVLLVGARCDGAAACLVDAAARAGVRVVVLPRGELRNCGALLAALRGVHARTRFVVLVEGVSITTFSDSHSELVRALRPADREESWAEAVEEGRSPVNNVLVVATSASGEVLRPGADAAAEGGALSRCFQRLDVDKM